MHVRRPSALLGAAAITTALVVVPTATATADELSCKSQAVGVMSTGKLLKRTVENGRQTAAKTSETKLPFRPNTLAWGGSEEVRGGYRSYFLATARDGRPRLLAVTDKQRRSTMSTQVTKFATTGFEPRLMALGNAGPEVLVLEGSVLKRYKIGATDSGLAMRGARTVLPRMSGLKTLSWYSRQRVSGVKQDIFYATTKSGSLKQVRVPVRRPANARVVTVKRGGFGAFTGLSLSYCNGDRSTAMIMGIDAAANEAKWYSLTRQNAPAGRNLTSHGLAAEGKNWRLRPTV